MSFDDFIISVVPQYQGFARSINEYMLSNGCALKITTAKNGLVVSYQHLAKKRVVMNFVFRKKRLVVRIYGDHVGGYTEFLETMPDSMKDAIRTAPSCKRFETPPRCSPKCGGNVFSISGVQYHKCRYSCFMFVVDDESIPFITAHIERELAARATGS